MEFKNIPHRYKLTPHTINNQKGAKQPANMIECKCGNTEFKIGFMLPNNRMFQICTICGLLTFPSNFKDINN